MDDGEDDLRTWFPCPFCYVEIELPVLCSHLQEEHCFDLINAVCPICAATLGKDAIGHFTMQHAHSVKRRRKSQRSGIWSNASATISKEFRELTSFLSSNSFSNQSHTQETAPDPFLSPFLCTRQISEPQDNCTAGADPCADVKSAKPSLPPAIQQQDYTEKLKRAGFIQELILSTIF